MSLVAAPGALATDDPTEAQYDPTVELITSGGGTGTPDQVGGLPFTGLDVAGLLAVAVGLTAVGIVLYRRSRHVAGSDATP